jgi:hypothetical protein
MFKILMASAGVSNVRVTFFMVVLFCALFMWLNYEAIFVRARTFVIILQAQKKPPRLEAL